MIVKEVAAAAESTSILIFKTKIGRSNSFISKLLFFFKPAMLPKTLLMLTQERNSVSPPEMLSAEIKNCKAFPHSSQRMQQPAGHAANTITGRFTDGPTCGDDL